MQQRLNKYSVIRNVLGCLCFLLSANLSNGQQFIARLNADSLKKVLLTAKDTQRINTLNYMVRRGLYSEESYDLSQFQNLSDQALRLSNELGYKRGVGNAVLNQIIFDLYQSKLKNAFPKIPFSRQLLYESNDRFGLAALYDFAGNIYQQSGDNRQAILYHDSAQVLYQQLGDTVTAVWNLTAKGNAFFSLGDYLNAYKIEKEALDLTPANDTTLKTVCLYYLSELFLGAGLPEMTLEQVKKIISFYPEEEQRRKISSYWSFQAAIVLGGEAWLQLNQIDSAVRLATIIKSPPDQNNVFVNLFHGKLMVALHHYDSAIVKLNKAEASALESGQPRLIAIVQRELARAYLGAKDYNKATYYAELAFSKAGSIAALLEKRNAAAILAEIYDAKKEYAKAYYYSRLEKKLNDSILPEQDKRKLSLLQVQNELSIKQQQAELLAKDSQLKEQQLKRASLLRNVLIVVLIILLVMTFVVIRNISLKRKNDRLRLEHKIKLHEYESETTKVRLEQHAAELEMKALRAQMNPHFIFNCLTAINHFILKNETETASDFLTRFSRLIRMVLQNSSHKYISLHDEIELLRLYTELEIIRFRDHFTYTLYCDPSLDQDYIQIPPMLLQPFIENAIWHGLMHREAGGHLSIHISGDEAHLTCIIEDNGIGRAKAGLMKSKSASLKKSMGMQITENRLKMLYGTNSSHTYLRVIDLIHESGEAAGTKVELTIPIRQMHDSMMETVKA